jgi:hypothetical protein
MVTDDECVSYARDCERLAGLTTDSELRERLLRMARDWMAMSIARGRGAESQPIETSQSIGTRGHVNFRALGPKF